MVRVELRILLFMTRFLSEERDIGRFVTEEVQTLAGIKDTFTMIAFKTFA